MSVPTEFKLNNGMTIPAVGLGTWKAQPGEVRNAVAHALKAGYRHIDCAVMYGNQNEVAQGIEDSGVKREDIFITSKLWSTYHDRVEEDLDKTLKQLNTSYLDLYLIHWPVRLVPDDKGTPIPLKEDGSRATDWDWDQSKTWAQMEDMLAKGKVKAIGVSNCGIPILEHLKKSWKTVPAVNQVEIHPYNPSHELKEWCDKEGIILEAYSPLGSTGSPLGKDEQVAKIAEKHNVAPATVLISYCVNKGIVVLPKSVTPARIESNLQVIKLSDDELAVFDKLAAQGKQMRINSPSWMCDFGFSDWYGPGNKDAPEGARLISKA
ncbi:putative NADP(+) coupled glycerol dehydrogenase [Kockovaella imperatae]|uniref:Putative NADP(+) coupled glycerol dehydrogenase n=1 Tax=Kockovaella imperatae TaxID=4999 RepID=A0A1Y1UH04_9TREE|nr:putative NADP(+) coupled glycerol dehydrogenase [Kockovaella imperatae]ORX37330.1 putative NADP(+) coupled glycerol dehydrogenase [Kockovaella imperatae]